MTAMWKTPIPADEDDRLEDLRRLDILLTAPEESLDHVTRELARIFGVPGAFISFIDADTQHYKSEVGLPPQFAEARTEPREISLCSYVVGTNESLIIEDLKADERFRDSAAAQEFGIRFYAGAPLRGDHGHAVGSLCIVDLCPRQITTREHEMLSVLAEGVMAQVRLQAASRQLVERAKVIERDLQRAVEVQRFLLPEALLTGGGWQIAHTYRPVEHLGGDCLDVQQRRDGSWAVLIADVTGHGTAAALTAVMTKAAFVRAAGDAAPPGEVLMEMNREFRRVAPPGQFVTAQVMVMHPGADRILIASAGHPYPLRMNRDGVTLVESDGGPPLFVDPQAKYGETVIKGVGEEDSILLYTDGAIEAADGDGRQLGIDGLRAIFERMRGTSTSVLEETLNGVLEHGQGRVRDDVALLLIRRCEET